MTGKILVVDDEDTLRLTLKARLTASSFDVETARDGEEALQKLRRAPTTLSSWTSRCQKWTAS